MSPKIGQVWEFTISIEFIFFTPEAEPYVCTYWPGDKFVIKSAQEGCATVAYDLQARQLLLWQITDFSVLVADAG